MNDKILEEVLEWYERQKKNPDIEALVDLVINKTADILLDEIKTELKNEFDTGNLKHPFIISGDYYLDLKMKEIKEKCVQRIPTDITPEE